MIPPLPKTRYHIGVVVYVQYGGSSGNEMVIYSISCPIQSVVANLDFMHSLDIKIILSALYSGTRLSRAKAEMSSSHMMLNLWQVAAT